MAFWAAAVVGMGIGWPYRLGQRWATEWAMKSAPKPASQTAVPVLVTRSFTPPWGVREEDRNTMAATTIRFGSSKQKTAGLKLMVEQRNWASIKQLQIAAADEHDPAVKALEIRIFGISRDASLGQFLKGFLTDENALIREAAADAVGIWCDQDLPSLQENENEVDQKPSSSDSLFDWQAVATISMGSFTIDCDPPITFYVQAPSRTRQPVVPGMREALEKVMLAGPTSGERQAAARSLVKWPPQGYRLRYAEWGVFMADSSGDVQFVREQLDEIPPFVHRVGNASGELSGRITGPPWAFKPVIHLTSNLPMAVNLEVCIEGGRPWVVYPRIDDLVMTPRRGAMTWTEGRFQDSIVANPFKSLDPTYLPPLNELNEGFPWTVPHHRDYPLLPAAPVQSTARPRLWTVGGIGVLWQSIIISPKKLDWMKPAEVTADSRFAWWKRLRDVDCSWISSRGEDERFLYYDGPTHRSTSVHVAIADRKLTIAGLGQNRPGLYIEVTPKGVSTRWIDDTAPLLSFPLAGLAKPTFKADEELVQILQKRGLTPSEAAGLVDCWKPAFFERPGRRFLTFMTPEDYDAACPMKIRPEPSDKVRVGIIWTELPP